MRIAAIGDTHGHRDWEIPSCDVFIHAGDMSRLGKLQPTVEGVFAKVKTALDEGVIKYAVLVPGNHDFCFENSIEACREEIRHPNLFILIDEGITLDGVSFYGTPWTPQFFNWAFMGDEGQLAEHFSRIPEGLDVLISHGPPRGILDPGWREEHVGSTALAARVEAVKPLHHVFGHLHGAGGQKVEGVTNFYNVAAVDEQYNLMRGCYVFDV